MSATKYAVADLDGVVYDFEDSLATHAAKVLQVPRSSFEAAACWDFFKDQWGWTTEQFVETYRSGVVEGSLLWEGTPYPASLEGWRDMLGRADTVHVMTDRSPAGAEREAAEATVFWLRRNGFEYDNISITADKVAAVEAARPPNAEVFCIDDKPENFEAYREAGYTSILFTRPWNLHVDTDQRVDSLAAFAALI